MDDNPRLKCLLCDDTAIAVFDMPGGCVVYPNEKIQPLCAHHIVRATPLGGMTMIEDLTLDQNVAKVLRC